MTRCIIWFEEGVVVTLLRTVRRQQQMTLDELAEQTGLTKSYLSKVERRLSMPSIAAAMKIARALHVDVGQLFSDQAAEAQFVVERATAPGEQRYWPVAAAMLAKTMSPFIVFPTEEFSADGHRVHSGQEFIFVHAGTIELNYNGSITVLDTGDCAYLDASLEHRMRSIGPIPARVVVVANNDTREVRK
ncbi:helix-turn-helix domain-containing protein [Nocardia aurantiaca]|uniref:Cupin domain-containing protein n=1 Tax=Nocardia aurantiaca TaxID=2675850 RepID=A0A6I3L7D6_9NOCA|nr:XRE family transcriptional regulator [Nocardia aurantiaca]MTE16890.1 cupin domain-containing protein [Nocardia aurantiaca]